MLESLDALETVKDERFQSYVINRIMPFPKILLYAGFGEYSYEGKCFCPFHDNYNSPAAKIYSDKMRGDSLFCFSEQKTYRPADILRLGLYKGKTVAGIFVNLWKQLTDLQKQVLLESYDKPVSYIPEAWENNKEKLELFKQGKIDIMQHIRVMQQCL